MLNIVLVIIVILAFYLIIKKLIVELTELHNDLLQYLTTRNTNHPIHSLEQLKYMNDQVVKARLAFTSAEYDYSHLFDSHERGTKLTDEERSIIKTFVGARFDFNTAYKNLDTAIQQNLDVLNARESVYDISKKYGEAYYESTSCNTIAESIFAEEKETNDLISLIETPLDLKKKILIFEDDPFIGEMYKNKFENEGFRVVWRQNPDDLISIVRQETPNLIIMDIIMPAIDGFTATKLLKADAQTKNIPIIGFDNLGDSPSMIQALRSGMDHYLIKSNHIPGEVIGVIRRVLNSSRNSQSCDVVIQKDGTWGPCDAHGITSDDLAKGDGHVSDYRNEHELWVDKQLRTRTVSGVARNILAFISSYVIWIVILAAVLYGWYLFLFTDTKYDSCWWDEYGDCIEYKLD